TPLPYTTLFRSFLIDDFPPFAATDDDDDRRLSGRHHASVPERLLDFADDCSHHAPGLRTYKRAILQTNSRNFARRTDCLRDIDVARSQHRRHHYGSDLHGAWAYVFPHQLHGWRDIRDNVRGVHLRHDYARCKGCGAIPRA